MCKGRGEDPERVPPDALLPKRWWTKNVSCFSNLAKGEAGVGEGEIAVGCPFPPCRRVLSFVEREKVPFLLVGFCPRGGRTTPLSNRRAYVHRTGLASPGGPGFLASPGDGSGGFYEIFCTRKNKGKRDSHYESIQLDK